MNAKALYELVKDLPREAWPSCVTGWIRGIYVEVRTSETGDKPHAVSSHMFADDAVLLFEASMTNWLVGEGFHRFEWDCGETDAVLPSLTLYDNGPFHGKTAVEMLAAAVKAVAS